MKRAIIVHCWEGTPDYCWYPWVKSELQKRDFDVQVPEMPETARPRLSGWLPKLQEMAGKPDEDLYLIGHSLGCITIMRYLESLEPGKKIGGVIFVAGFTDGLDAEKYPDIQNFFETPIDYEKIKSHCNKFVFITSDNDPYVPLKYADTLKDKLGGEIIIKPGAQHFSGAIEGEDACLELPEVVGSIKRLSR